MEVVHRAKTNDAKYGVINKTGRILKKSKAELMCTGKSLPVVNDKTTIDVCQKKQVSRLGKLRKKFIAELKCTGKSLPVINDKTTINVCQMKQDSGLGRSLKKSKAELKCTWKSSPVINDKTTIAVCQKKQDSGLGRLLKKSKSELKCKGKSSPVINDKTSIVVCQTEQDSHLGTKRKAEGVLQSQNVKRSKIDDCQGVLAKLIRHKWSCPFLNPVDPKAAGDYYQVIKHPMDFKTVERKLQQNAYTDLDEFEFDVRLIFTNAMMYHPCNNWIHLYASKLSRLFDIIWTPAQVIEEPTIKENPGLRNNSLQDDKGLDSLADLSPTTALRAAKLRARFAETILGAQNKVKSATDLMTSEEEKHRLRQQHDEAKSKIEAEVKSAELACQLEINKKRQVEREAARSALQKMGRTVDIDNDNWRVMKDIEALIGSAIVYRNENRKTKGPLERLGLYLKPEYKLEDDDDDRFLQNMELEEGEILD